MPIPVVDELETIEIEQRHPKETFQAACVGAGMNEAVEKQRTIRQSGERIAQGERP